MDATSCLAGCSIVSFKNQAIEHPGKGMKPRQISTKSDRVMTGCLHVCQRFQPQLFQRS